jgi:hypothetical protein
LLAGDPVFGLSVQYVDCYHSIISLLILGGDSSCARRGSDFGYPSLGLFCMLSFSEIHNAKVLLIPQSFGRALLYLHSLVADCSGCLHFM